MSNPKSFERQFTRNSQLEQVENLAKPNQKSKISEQKNQDTLALERRLTETLGAKTTINNGKKGGVVNIRYGSLDELQGIIDKIGK
jgi:ParB family chromosome partitioning protein